MAKAPDYLRARGLADDPLADPLPGFGFDPNTGMIVDPNAQSAAPGFATMPDDYQARVLALRTAMDCVDSEAAALDVVKAAQVFHAFLTNTEPQAQPDPKDRTFTDE